MTDWPFHPLVSVASTLVPSVGYKLIQIIFQFRYFNAKHLLMFGSLSLPIIILEELPSPLSSRITTPRGFRPTL